MREFFIHNALYWIEEFHLDGLRLDAVHAILDDSPKHLLEELAERVRAAAPDRHIHLVLENEENQARAPGCAARTAGRAGTPRNGTTTSTTCCTWRRAARRKGYYADYKGDHRRSWAALWRRASPSRAS